MRIVFYPDTLVKNKYIERMIRALQSNFVELVNKDSSILQIMKLSLFWRIGKGVKIFHFNWLLTSISKKSMKNYLVSFLLFLWFILIKCLGCKVIWTVHNKYPHDCKNKKLIRLYRRFLFFVSDRIIIHSRDTKRFIASIMQNRQIMNKVVYVPHGNYIGCYRNPGIDARNRMGIPANAFVFLHIGLIKPYKNIDVLMTVFASLSLPNTRLLIAGYVASTQYQAYLNRLAAENVNILFFPQFIPDDEIGEIINSGDIIILPYAKESFINSGSLYLSLSFSKPVIIPDIGIARDFSASDFIFTYSYKNREDHYIELKKIIDSIYTTYSHDKTRLKLLGQTGYDYVNRNNNWNDIGAALYEIYQSSLGR